MKLKKIIMATIFIAIGMTAFTAGLKPKEGYLKLKWGTSTDDAKKAGYNLSEVSAADKEFLKQNYSEGVSAYIVTSKDKTPTELQFFYYMGRLFQVTELLPENQSSRDKLEKRYGKFPEIGILEIGDQYACVELTKEGKLEAYWLIITKHPKGGVITSFYDWNIFKNVSAFGKQLAGNDTKEEKSFVGELSSLAEKLVQDGNGKAIGFVKPGNNHHIAIYKDEHGTLQESVVTFWHAVERKKYGLPIIITNPAEAQEIAKAKDCPDEFTAYLPNEKWSFEQSLQENEMFIMGLANDIYENALVEKNYSLLNQHLYRVQKISSSDYYFRHHLETKLDDSASAIEIGKYKRIRSFKAFQQQNPHKVKISLLGKLITKKKEKKIFLQQAHQHKCGFGVC